MERWAAAVIAPAGTVRLAPPGIPGDPPPLGMVMLALGSGAAVETDAGKGAEASGETGAGLAVEPQATTSPDTSTARTRVRALIIIPSRPCDPEPRSTLP
jgi:hypothetical protein